MKHFSFTIFTCALAAVMITARPAHAATVTIDVANVTALNNAITTADANPGNYYILRLASGTFTLTKTLTLTMGKVEITGSVNSPSTRILDAANIDKRAFFVDRPYGATRPYLLLSGVTVRNGETSSGGGCIYVSGGDLVVSSSVVENCTSSLAGSAIYAYDAKVNLFHSIIRGNSNPFYQNGGGGVQASGGGLYANGASTVEITRTTFTNNTSVRGGGFMIAGSSTLAMRESTISGNKAVRGGGVMISGSGAVRIFFSTIYNNKAGLSGASEPRVGGGIIFTDYAGLLQFQGNIVAKNENTVPGYYPTPGDDCYVENPNSGRWSEVRYFTNAIGKLDDTCVNRLGHFMVWGIGGQTWPYDPQLGPLTSNGTNYGQVLPTHLPLTNSPVRRAYHRSYGPGSISIGASCYSDDNRAKPRRSAPEECDVGAVEATGN